MGEREQSHRHRMDSWEVAYGFSGMACGLIVGIYGLSLAAYLALHGQPWIGGVLGGGTLVSLVGAFVYVRHGQQKEPPTQNHEPKS